MIGYKLFRVRKSGEITSLFINRSRNLPVGKWMKSELRPTKGFAVRKGWHVMAEPKAPHLSMRGRAWYSVEIKRFEPFTRPVSQGGLWYLADNMRILGPLIIPKPNEGTDS